MIWPTKSTKINCFWTWAWLFSTQWPLTRATQSSLLRNRINHAIRSCSKNPPILAICYMDIDDFKKINDSFGHSYGGEILKQFANRLSPILRSSDTLARIGGDEFIVLIENLQQNEDVTEMVSKIQALFHAPFIVKEQKFFLSISLGVSFILNMDWRVKFWLKMLMLLCIKPKIWEKTPTHFTPSIPLTIASYERIGLENALRRAIKEKNFKVYYQPQIDLKTDDVCGLEALIRWNHQKRDCYTQVRLLHWLKRPDWLWRWEHLY